MAAASMVEDIVYITQIDKVQAGGAQNGVVGS